MRGNPIREQFPSMDDGPPVEATDEHGVQRWLVAEIAAVEEAVPVVDAGDDTHRGMFMRRAITEALVAAKAGRLAAAGALLTYVLAELQGSRR